MFSKFFSKKIRKSDIISNFKIDFGYLGFSNDYVDIVDLTIKRDFYFKDSDISHIRHDVACFVFEKYTFMLFFNVSEHGWAGSGFNKFSVPTLNVVYFKENSNPDDSFSIVDQKFWYRQIDQMIDVLIEIDKINPGDF